jgi:hypothetical protein
MLPGSPNVKISNIGKAIFQDIKEFAVAPFMCRELNLGNTDKKG